jgi:hypothetical protein
LSFDITGFVQSLVERRHIRCRLAGRPAAEEPDNLHRLLLRAAKGGYATAPAKTVMRFRRFIRSSSIRRWRGLWLYRATSQRLDEWRLSTHPSHSHSTVKSTAVDRGCVKTLASQQGGELFSLLPFSNRGHSAIRL